LTAVLFITIGGGGYFQIRKLKNKVKEHEHKAMQQLKKIFPARHSALKLSNLRTLFRQAQRKVTAQEEAWRPFFQENLQPLEILKELTQTINKRAFTITIEKLILSRNEEGETLVDLTGIFVSKTDKHFADYTNFVKYFEKNSTLLFIDTKDEAMAEPEGVQFTFNLKLKGSKK